MLAVNDRLFNLFAATHHIAGRSSIRNLRTRHAVVTPPKSETHNFCLQLKSFSQHTLLGYSEKFRTHRLSSVHSLLYSGNSKFFLHSSIGQLTARRHLAPNLRMREAVLAVHRNAFIVTNETTPLLQVYIYIYCFCLHLKEQRAYEISFSIIHGHVQVDTHTRTLCVTHAHTHTHALCVSHTHTHSHCVSHTHTHTHTHSHCVSHTHTHALCVCLSLSHTHTHTLYVSLSLTQTRGSFDSYDREARTPHKPLLCIRTQQKG